MMSHRWIGLTLTLAVALAGGCGDDEEDVSDVTIEAVAASDVGADYEAIVASGGAPAAAVT